MRRTKNSVQGKAYNMKTNNNRYRPPLSDEEFNRRYEKHMEKGVYHADREKSSGS